MRGARWVAIVLLIALLPGPALAAAGSSPAFIAPVEGRITKPFKLLSNQRAAGSHRGIDYGVPAGTPVKASGAGTVTHAGPVADDGLFVTIAHKGGLATTYSYLSQVDVIDGQQVAQGDVIGATGEGHPGEGSPALHFGAKKDGKYIDPQLLLHDFRDITDLIRMVPIQEEARSQSFPPSSGDSGGDMPALKDPTLSPPGPGTFSLPPPTVKLIRTAQDVDPSGVSAGSPGAVTPQLQAPNLDAPSFELPKPPATEPLGGISFDPSAPPASSGLAIPEGRSASVVAQWWNKLNDDQRAQLINDRPDVIGKLVGIDAASRDKANRLRLKRELDQLVWERQRIKADLKRIDSNASAVDRLNPAFYLRKEALSDALESIDQRYAGASLLWNELSGVAATAADGLEHNDVFLLDYDTRFANRDGTAVVALGDPDTAEHVTLVVPGLGSRLNQFDGPIQNAAELRSTIYKDIDPSVASKTSIIAWLGYDAPDSLPDARGRGEAKVGAAQLKRFVDDLRAVGRSNGHWQHVAVFGHSYGSTVTGLAGRLGILADDLVLIASPGAGGMNAKTIGGKRLRIWAARTENDIIKWSLGIASLGDDPTNKRGFGSRRFKLDNSQRGHSASVYYKPRSTGLLNLARIATGRYDDVLLRND